MLELLQQDPPEALAIQDVDKHWWLMPDGSDGLNDAQRRDFGIYDPVTLPGRRRRLAVPDPYVDDYIDGLTVQDILNPEANEPFNVEGPPLLVAPAAPVDRDRYDNRRIPSYDEPLRRAIQRGGRAPVASQPRGRGRGRGSRGGRGRGGRAGTQPAGGGGDGHLNDEDFNHLAAGFWQSMAAQAQNYIRLQSILISGTQTTFGGLVLWV